MKGLVILLFKYSASHVRNQCVPNYLFSQPLTSKSNVHRTFQTPPFLFLRKRLYIFQDYHQDTDDQVPFSFANQKATIGQNTSLTENRAILKSQLCAYM